MEDPSSPAGLEPRRLQSALLRWYRLHRRDLPWRAPPGQAPDPYRVWVSEVMLQQTRVEAVVPYFARWMERFPSLQALARAPRDEVMKAWEGLGYYSRARNLHRAAAEVVDRHGARVPADAAAFRELPGVGRYTAGAVMSIAFGRPEPVVDGNVRRVLARLLDEPSPSDARLWSIAGALVPHEHPGDFNQAMMELGATVCTPRGPRCDECPLEGLCAARAAGTQHERPRPRRRGTLPVETAAVAVIHRGDAVLIARRPVDVRLGGMWEFPSTQLRPGEPTAEAARRAALDGLGLQIDVGDQLGEVEHVFTHVRVRYQVVRCTWTGGDPLPLGYDACTWISPRALADYALPAAQHRIAALALPPRTVV